MPCIPLDFLWRNFKDQLGILHFLTFSMLSRAFSFIDHILPARYRYYRLDGLEEGLKGLTDGMGTYSSWSKWKCSLWYDRKLNDDPAI